MSKWINVKPFVLGVIIGLGIILSLFVVINWNDTADYDQNTALSALENGDSLVGKTIDVEVSDTTESLLGFVFYTSNDLTFINDEILDINKGDWGRVKVVEANKLLGSWVITYEVVQGGKK
ncbi:MAG: hypothetical protein RR643_04935 [Anaerorhabdus sp.]|uniref:hypothetical protein n=1 Tax=Anaerorhabdus sp. TaxID=1872524 RepID=UPI002FCC5FD5